MGNSSSKPSGPPRFAATFPGDPDHGKVILDQKSFKPIQPKSRLLNNRMRCYMDIAIDGHSAGRIIFDLRPDLKPRTCENFRALCTADSHLSYKGCRFHRIVPGFILQTGDVELKGQKQEGKGGLSIYGRSFADEKIHKLSHDAYGVVSMANSGPHTNNSQFMIVVDPKGADWLDGNHTVFATVAKESFQTLQKIEACAEVFDRDSKRRARILNTCTIVDCGQL